VQYYFVKWPTWTYARTEYDFPQTEARDFSMAQQHLPIIIIIIIIIIFILDRLMLVF
jgi:hypothetical protein